MLNKEHYSSAEVVPIHFATPAQLRALGLCTQGLEPVATVQSKGQTLPLYEICKALPERAALQVWASV